MLKHELRTTYKEKRETLSPFFISENSLSIANRLLKLGIWQYSYYHIFLSIVEKKELDTEPILALLHAKDKNVIIPKVEKNQKLDHFLLTDSTTLKLNKWGIPEPLEGVEVKEEKIDVVFVPLLAFDKNGNRVGYGKGFYDTFLKKCRTDVIKIGLSLFEVEETPITDVNDHDVPLDYCVTPNKTYTF